MQCKRALPPLERRLAGLHKPPAPIKNAPALGHSCSAGRCGARTNFKPQFGWKGFARRHPRPSSVFSEEQRGRESRPHSLNAEVFRQLGLWQMILMKSSCLVPVNRLLYAAFCPNRVKSEDRNFFYIHIYKNTCSLKSKLY